MNSFEEYIKIEEVAKKWEITPRRVQSLCAAGKIEGATRFGRDWMIPKNALKPIDGRTKAGRQEQAEVGNVNMPIITSVVIANSPIFKIAAPAIIGTDRRNVNLVIASLLSPINLPARIVVPLLEKPGNTAKA